MFRSKRKHDNHGGAGGGNKKMKEESVLSEAPREINVALYAEHHAHEILELSKKVSITDHNKNIAQKLPPHMRRRAMSHNVKRLPRDVRHQAAAIVGEKIKKPSRYHRRRPKNLREEYNRRQKKHIWLETHIWHAKRFHMVEKWGYKLPWKPTMKSERACYRATSKHCLLQDLSFMCCIELIGAEDNLLDGLRQITSSDTGQTFAAVSCLKGTREGHTMIYKRNKYPWNAIGLVSFLWNPDQPISDKSKFESTNQRQLWIWCHPGCFDEVWNELNVCLGLTEEIADESLLESERKDKPANEKSEKKNKTNGSEEKDASEEELPEEKYKSRTVAVNNDKHLQMKSLTGSLLKFSLTGPQSVAVLLEAITLANIVSVQQSDENEAWWKNYYGNTNFSLGHVNQRGFVESLAQCQAPSELPSHCVVAMTTRDPRILRPTTRRKAVADENTLCQDISSFHEKLTVDVSSSPLWNQTIREEVVRTMSTDYQIYEMKSQQLVPGLPLDLGDKESRIPILIIQRPGVTSLGTYDSAQTRPGQGGGFDLVIPKGWGMAFWQALVYQGARVGGLREQECNAFEEKTLLFPNDYPDSNVGQEFEQNLEKEKVEKYNRLQPGKRPNFTKFGIISPYRCPWSWLVRHWNGSNLEKTTKSDNNSTIENNVAMGTDTQTDSKESDVNVKPEHYVLRDVKLLRNLQKLCSVQDRKKGGEKHPDTDVNEIISKEHPQALIAVKLKMVQRGCPGEFSLICLPSLEDLNKLSANENYSGPVETPLPDPVLIEKQKCKRQMKQKGLKGRIKVDRNLKMISEKNFDNLQIGSREVIGYLKSGGFSLGIGNGVGVGFVATLGLVKLLNECQNRTKGCIVLVRGNSTLQYRFARLSIVL